MVALQVRRNAVQIGDIERNSAASKSYGGASGYLTESCGHFQQRQALEARDGNDSFEESARGSDSAEPSVDAGEIAQRGLRFVGRTILGIKDLLCVRALHVV